MKTNKCPKCQSEQLYTMKNDLVNPHNHYSNDNDLMESYVCLDCGYIENYIRKEKLNTFKTKHKLKKEGENL